MSNELSSLSKPSLSITILGGAVGGARGDRLSISYGGTKTKTTYLSILWYVSDHAAMIQSPRIEEQTLTQPVYAAKAYKRKESRPYGLFDAAI